MHMCLYICTCIYIYIYVHIYICIFTYVDSVARASEQHRFLLWMLPGLLLFSLAAAGGYRWLAGKERSRDELTSHLLA